MEKRKIIIDTDPGIDDALAILLAIASPEYQVEGLSIVHGNCSLEQAVFNALSLLEIAGATHIPVVRGYPLPLVQPSLLAPETHGKTGLGYAVMPEPTTKPIVQHAEDFLIEKVLANPNEITIFAIGPLTNLATAIRKEPRIVDLIPELIIMGGAIRHQGNTTPLAEFNTYVDPHAAHIVYHSGIPITLCPLDVTYQCILTPGDVSRLLELDSPVTQFIADSTRFYMEFHDEYQKIEGCVINDPLAVAVGLDPSLIDAPELYVDVDIAGGISMGNTFADFYHMTDNKPNMKVGLEVRPRDFMELFLQRIEAFVQK